LRAGVKGERANPAITTFFMRCTPTFIAFGGSQPRNSLPL
jgi:hypothetical protein